MISAWSGILDVTHQRRLSGPGSVLGGPAIAASDLSFNPWAFVDSPRGRKANAQDAEKKTIIAAGLITQGILGVCAMRWVSTVPQLVLWLAVEGMISPACPAGCLPAMLAQSPEAALSMLGTGPVAIEAVPAALWCAATATTPVEGLFNAVNAEGVCQNKTGCCRRFTVAVWR